MKADEFAFFNQQLAGMLKSGIPLEGALRQLSRDMAKGRLHVELEQLRVDLEQGVPLEKALSTRNLPDFYKQMVILGAKSNDLPGVLVLLADYYQKLSTVRLRLKGLMVYPAIVLVVSVAISTFLGFIYHVASTTTLSVLPSNAQEVVANPILGLWLPTAFLVVLTILFFVVIGAPGARAALRWYIPGFKEATLSQFASSLAMLLKNGVPLNDALQLVANLDSARGLNSDLQQWQRRLSMGHSDFQSLTEKSHVFPKLFRWLVASSGEDWVSGLNRAADLYYSRALHRTETMLYAALPAMVLVLGFIILAQFIPMFRVFVRFMNFMTMPFE